jgi:hypothetical protein
MQIKGFINKAGKKKLPAKGNRLKIIFFMDHCGVNQIK